MTTSAPSSDTSLLVRHQAPLISNGGAVSTIDAMRLLAYADRHGSRKWIRRRVEEMIALNERVMKRYITLHIDLSKIDVAPLITDSRQVMVLPIDRLPRSSHVMTTVEMVERGEIMRPIAKEERRLVISGLCAKWTSLSTTSLQDINHLLLTPVRSVPKLLRAFITDTAAKHEAFRVYNKISRRTASVIQRTNIDKDDLLADLVRWHQHYLVLVEIPLDWIVNDSCIIKICYLEHIPGLHVVDGDGFHLRRLGIRIRKLVAGSLSWAVQIPVRNAIGPAESTHLVIEAPEGFRAVDAVLKVRYNCDTGQVVDRTYRDDDRLPNTGHVFVDTKDRDVESADFAVSFYAYRTGFFLESLAAGWVLYLVARLFYDQILQAHFAVHGDGINANLTAALILLLPAAVVTLVTQRDTHRVASRCFAFVRIMLAVSAIASLLSAALLALPFTKAEEADWWRIIVWVTGIVAVRLSVGGLVHLYRIGRVRQWMWSHAWIYQDKKSEDALNEIDP